MHGGDFANHDFHRVDRQSLCGIARTIWKQKRKDGRENLKGLANFHRDLVACANEKDIPCSRNIGPARSQILKEPTERPRGSFARQPHTVAVASSERCEIGVVPNDSTSSSPTVICAM